MPEYILLYNRLTQQNIGPKVPPATVTGDDPKTALKKLFGYSFRRVYGEAAKSPDVVVAEGTVLEDGTFNITNKHLGRAKYIAVHKLPDKEVKRREVVREKDERTHRYIKKR